MAIISVDIDDQLMNEAVEVFGPNATKAAAVRAALELAVRLERQQKAIDWLARQDPQDSYPDWGRGAWSTDRPCPPARRQHCRPSGLAPDAVVAIAVV